MASRGKVAARSHNYSICELIRCNRAIQRLQWLPPTFMENGLSDQTMENIEAQLRLLNTNVEIANDIAMLAAFPTMPADLDNDSRKALRHLRDTAMKRAIERAKL